MKSVPWTSASDHGFQAESVQGQDCCESTVVHTAQTSAPRAGVWMEPGATALTLTPLAPHACARLRVSCRGVQKVGEGLEKEEGWRESGEQCYVAITNTCARHALYGPGNQCTQAE